MEPILPAPPEQLPAEPAAAPTATVKPAYPPTAEIPTQEGPDGIRYDFNQGARVLLPARTSGQWRVRLRDVETGNILFNSENAGALIASTKRWFVRFGIEVWDLEGDAERLVLEHKLDLTGQDVLIQFPVGTLGDTLAWFPYAARFASKHPGSRIICAMSGLIIPILRAGYPDITFLTHEEVVEQGIAATAYATYCLGLFFDDVACEWQPTDFRLVGLHRTAGYILGVDPAEEPATITLPDETRPIAAPYAVIAVQSSSGCKYWNNPEGWRAVVKHLASLGYRVICIDQKPVHGHGLLWTQIPHGSEDETGDRPLAERARWLRHADLFVGLSSGLSWLAWSVGCPAVLISGFTHPRNEFNTPFRVINWHTCNSCWNDTRLRFDHGDFQWCPRHANTPRQFECTRLITAEQVIGVINTVPSCKQVLAGAAS